MKPVSSALSTGSNLWTNGVVHWTPDAQDYPQLGTGSFTLADLETNTVVVSETGVHPTLAMTCTRSEPCVSWSGEADCMGATLLIGSLGSDYVGYSNGSRLVTAQENACRDLGEVIIAMSHWERHTGVSFVPQANPTGDYVKLEVGATLACNYNAWNALNMSQRMGNHGGKNELRVMNNGGCLYDDMVHELGHVLGLWHTMGRQDRDDYVIYQGGNFGVDGVVDATNFNQPAGFADVGPFDFDSQMMYGSYAFKTSKVFKDSDGDISLVDGHFMPPTTNAEGIVVIEIDVRNFYQGAGWQHSWTEAEYWQGGPWGYYRVSAETFTIDVTTVAGCFTATLTSPFTTTAVEPGIIQVPLSLLPPTTASTTLGDATCYQVEREGVRADEPSLRRKNLPFSDPDATWMKPMTPWWAPIPASDTSGVLDQYADNNDMGSPAATGDEFGAEVAHGDFDRDGVVDLAVAAPGEGTIAVLKGAFKAGDDSGRVYHVPWKLLQAPGVQTVAVGDFNSDGMDDLAAGGHTSSNPSGFVTAFSSGVLDPLSEVQTFDMTTIPEWVAARNGADEFGSSLAVGDVDGDGIEDLVVGAPGATAVHFDPAVHNPGSGTIGARNSGIVAVLLGSRSSELVPDATVFDPFGVRIGTFGFPIEGTQQGVRFGEAVHVADLDNDGQADILIGAPQEWEIQLTGSGATMVAQTHFWPIGPTPPSRGAVFITDFAGADQFFDQTAIDDTYFGASITSSFVSRAWSGNPGTGRWTTQWDGPGRVWIAAPHGPGGVPMGDNGGAGEVYEYDISEGKSLSSPRDTLMSTDFSASCPADVLDRFGEAIAYGVLDKGTSKAGYLAVGAPGKDLSCTGTIGNGGVYLYRQFAGNSVTDGVLEPGTGLGPMVTGPFSDYGQALAFQPEGRKCFSFHGEVTATDYTCGSAHLTVGVPSQLKQSPPGPSGGGVWETTYDSVNTDWALVEQ